MTDADKALPLVAPASAPAADAPDAAPAPGAAARQHAAAGTAGAASAQRTAWVLFAPPALLVGLGWVLAWLHERGAQAVLLPLTPFEPAPDVWTVLQPVLRVLLAGALVLVLAVWARRRVGPRRVARALGVAWVVLCLAGAAGLVWRDLNLRGAQPLPPVPAQVIGSRAKAPSTRGPGGTLLVLNVHSLKQPQQVLVDDPQAAGWRHGQRLLLTWSRGRYQGLFVTGWRPLSSPGPAQLQVRVQAHTRAQSALHAVALAQAQAAAMFTPTAAVVAVAALPLPLSLPAPAGAIAAPASAPERPLR